MPAAKLIRPSTEYKESFLSALDEYHKEGRFSFYNNNEIYSNFEEFIENLRNEKGHRYRPYESWVEPVPETILWLVKDMEYIGSIYIRHRINWHLEKWGGHIYFAIRPSMRNKGFGKKILKKSIPYANYIGIDKALITVDPDNKAAQRIIEFCGGKEDDITPATNQFPSQKRYWLDCT